MQPEQNTTPYQETTCPALRQEPTANTYVPHVKQLLCGESFGGFYTLFFTAAHGTCKSLYFLSIFSRRLDFHRVSSLEAWHLAVQ